MNALAVAVTGPCPASADTADLVSLGMPDHGVSVYLGRCRYCAVPLLAVVTLSEDLPGGGPFLEVHGAQL